MSRLVFLREHKRFGLPEDDVVLFCQGTMPAVDANSGKLLLAEQGTRCFLVPMDTAARWRHWRPAARSTTCGGVGIEHLFYLQVDNPLTPICDPEFIGYHLLANSELTSMAVPKQTPQDRVGVFAMIDGQMQVIEYSDLPDDVAAERDARGLA